MTAMDCSLDARRELAEALDALVAELPLGKTMALPGKIQRVQDTIEPCLIRRSRTRELADGSVLTIQSSVLQSAVRYTGGVRLRPSRSWVIQRLDGSEAHNTKGADWRWYPDPKPPYAIDDFVSDLLRIKELCLHLRHNTLPADVDAVKQLALMADRIVPKKKEEKPEQGKKVLPNNTTSKQLAESQSSTEAKWTPACTLHHIADQIFVTDAKLRSVQPAIQRLGGEIRQLSKGKYQVRYDEMLEPYRGLFAKLQP